MAILMSTTKNKTKPDLARKTRFLKKQGKNQAPWISNCRMLVKMNGTPEQTIVLCIRNTEQLVVDVISTMKNIYSQKLNVLAKWIW